MARTDLDALEAMLEDMDDKGKKRKIDGQEMSAALKQRVKGQDHVINDVSQWVRLQWGKSNRDRPVATFLFLGPTGTGKTELAKAMTEFLFADEKNSLRFDCSEFSGPEGKTRLIGTPTGYVGAEKGGQLTRPILNNPKQLILFDEIEKAYPEVFDLFLQMMGDGRLTEQGSGKVADFTQSIIVLTSNAEADAISTIQNQVDDYHEMVNAVKSHLADTKVFRPEIIGRIDRVYVFKPLAGKVLAEIIMLKMSSLAKQYNLELDYVAPEIIIDALKKGNKLSKFGVRELDRVINDLLAEAMLEAQEAGAKIIRLDIGEDGIMNISPAD